MTVSVLLAIRIPGARSLKDRRAVVRSLVERLRSRLDLAAAETGGQDRLRYAEVGFAVVSGDRATARSRAEEALRFVDEELLGRGEVVRTVIEETHLDTGPDGGVGELPGLIEDGDPASAG